MPSRSRSVKKDQRISEQPDDDIFPFKVLAGRKVFRVMPVPWTMVKSGYGSTVSRKERRILVAEGLGFEPFLALAKAIRMIESKPEATRKPRKARAAK